MPSVEKLIEKMKNQPKGMRPEEIDKVLAHRGYSAQRQRGSHRQYRNTEGMVITVPQTNPIDKAYVVDILERIGEI